MADQELSSQQLEALKALIPKRETLSPEHRALVEELAKQQGIPLGKTPTAMDETLAWIKPAALPMLGQAAFGAAGSPAGIPGIIAGEMAGGVIGTKANEMFGITKPTSEDYALSAGAPLIGAGIGRLYRRLIPGAAAAEQEIGAERLRALSETLGAEGRDAVNAAYAAVGQTPLKVSHFANKVREIQATQATLKGYGEQSPRMARSMAKTEGRVAAQGEEIPLTDANALLKQYRAKADSLETAGGEQWGAYKALRGSLLKDLRLAAESATGAEAALLRQAMITAKKQIAKEELTEVIGKYGLKAETVGTATFETINPTRVLNKLRDMDFKETVGAQQWQKIESTLKQLAKISHPGETTKTAIGTPGRAIAMTGAGIIGSGAAATMGATAPGMMGGAAGAALSAYAAIAAHDAVANLMMNDFGRRLLVKLFTHNLGRFGPVTAEVLQFAASQFQEAGDMTPQREKQVSELTELATNPNPDELRRRQLGLSLSMGPRMEQAP